MFTPFRLAIKFLKYYFTASNGKGHGIHSPFVFDFIRYVLRDKKKYDCYSAIETGRQKLLNQSAKIEVEDFGAGSSVLKTGERRVSDMARSSLKPAKFAQLLYRMVKYYRPGTILELGTSFGITTSYLANANDEAAVYTIEGSVAIAGIARNTFSQLGLHNIELIEGEFNSCLPPLLSKLKTIDFVFIDGHHLMQPTLDYFQQLLDHANDKTILIFDDIHWSREMEEAWAAIQQHQRVTLTIDLFFIGIVFVNPDILHQQHFIIRF